MGKQTIEELEAQVKQLAAERDAVVAENVALKAFGDKLSDMRNDLNGEGTGIQGRAEVACQQIALEAAMEEFDTIKTPDTDAILASLRAEGVDMFAESQKAYVRDNRNSLDAMNRAAYCGSALDAERFAAQLRSQSVPVERLLLEKLRSQSEQVKGEQS